MNLVLLQDFNDDEFNEDVADTATLRVFKLRTEWISFSLTGPSLDDKHTGGVGQSDVCAG